MDNKEYRRLFLAVQSYIEDNYATELAGMLDTGEGANFQRNIIRQYLFSKGLADEKLETRLFEDLAGTGCLAPLLSNRGLREININSHERIQADIDGKEKQISDTFLSPESEVDILKRILSRDGKIIDDTKPGVKASLDNGTRIAVLKYPIVEKSVGAVASIRRVNHGLLSENQIIRTKATAQIMDFLYLCIRHGVSICFAGRTGSGKTTTANWLLSKIPRSRRLVTIEEGSREFNVDGAISLISHPELGFDLSTLLDYALWFHPDFIAVGEMLSYEAFVAQETARTGHTVITTTHSNSAESTYRRMLTLAQRFPGQHLDKDTLMELMVEAFPIIVYMKNCDDGQFRIMEVMEGESYSPATGIKHRSIFRFVVTDNEYRGNTVIIHGQHIQKNGISDRLQQVLYDNGARESDVEKYAKSRGEIAV